MKTPFTYALTGLAAVLVGGAVALAPAASAAPAPAPIATSIQTVGTDPLIPYGPEPQVPGRLGYVDSNHDEANTTNGQVDLPF